MNTASFLAELRASPDLPLVFRAGRHTVSPGYHLTEVKRVAFETMDCGAMAHRWAETHFEIWVPPLVGGLPGRAHLTAGKFLAIVERVERELPLEPQAPARIYAALGATVAGLYDVGAVYVQDEKLYVELTAGRARCKAAERRVAAATGGCCGSDFESETAQAASEYGCGCGTTKAAAVGASCA